MNHIIIKLFFDSSKNKNKLKEFDLLSSMNENIIKMKPLGFNDYIKLQKDAACTISDSGTISEESSILRFSAITIRETHERPEAMDEGTLIMSGLNKENVLRSLKIAMHDKNFKITKDYKVENLSSKIVKIILSYTHYINNFTWKKNQKF